VKKVREHLSHVQKPLLSPYKKRHAAGTPSLKCIYIYIFDFVTTAETSETIHHGDFEHYRWEERKKKGGEKTGNMIMSHLLRLYTTANLRGSSVSTGNAEKEKGKKTGKMIMSQLLRLSTTATLRGSSIRNGNAGGKKDKQHDYVTTSETKHHGNFERFEHS